jgi:hypothetical protein
MNWDDKVMEDFMGGTSSTHGKKRGMHTGFWWVKQKERDHLHTELSPS